MKKLVGELTTTKKYKIMLCIGMLPTFFFHKIIIKALATLTKQLFIL